MAKTDLDSFSIEEHAALRDNATDKKSDEKQSNEATEKKVRKKTRDADAEKPSPAHRSGNPIGRAYNG